MAAAAAGLAGQPGLARALACTINHARYLIRCRPFSAAARGGDGAGHLRAPARPARLERLALFAPSASRRLFIRSLLYPRFYSPPLPRVSPPSSVATKERKPPPPPRSPAEERRIGRVARDNYERGLFLSRAFPSAPPPGQPGSLAASRMLSNEPEALLTSGLARFLRSRDRPSRVWPQCHCSPPTCGLSRAGARLGLLVGLRLGRGRRLIRRRRRRRHRETRLVSLK